MRRRWSLFAAVAALSFVTGGWLVRRAPAPGGDVYQQARLFEDVLTAIRTHYVDSISETDLYFRATRGIVDYLSDPYSVLLVEDGLDRHAERLSGTYEGLGLQLEVQSGSLVIMAVEPGSPADRSGILPGDRLVAIDGIATKGWNGEQALAALRGEPGTPVSLLVRRGAAAPVPHELVRSRVHESAVPAGLLLEDGIGFVALRRMTTGSAEELHQRIRALRDSGMTALVLDLRYNPGGVLSEGIAAADLFLDPGQTIGTMRGRSVRDRTEYVDQDEQAWPELPVVLLVNGGTASSAEIAAGALQDHDRAVLLGTPTFGKGAVQSTIPLGDRVALKLTTARWHTPSGRSLQRPVRLTRPDEPREVVALADTVPAAEPFRSDSGRILPAHSGLHPDVVVPGESVGAAERALAAALGSDLSAWYDAVTAFAAELAAAGGITDERFAVTPAMRRALRTRMDSLGMRVPDPVWQRATDVVDRELADAIAAEAFGALAARRRRLESDPQVRAAVELLRETGSRGAVFETVFASEDAAAD